MRWQGKPRRRYTGGRLIYSRGKRKFETGRESADTTLGEVVWKEIIGMGGNKKVRLYKTSIANVTDPKTHTTKTAKIITVSGNPSNVHYVRRNIINRGAIIKTELGSARVTNRPGQDGIVNAVLIETKPVSSPEAKAEK